MSVHRLDRESEQVRNRLIAHSPVSAQQKYLTSLPRHGSDEPPYSFVKFPETEHLIRDRSGRLIGHDELLYLQADSSVPYMIQDFVFCKNIYVIVNGLVRMQILPVDPDLHEDILNDVFGRMGILYKVAAEIIETHIVLLEEDFETQRIPLPQQCYELSLVHIVTTAVSDLHPRHGWHTHNP